MREFITIMLNPVLILYLLLITGFILFALKKKRAGRYFVIIAGLWLFLITTPFLPKYMIKSLESKYHQLSDSTLRKINSPCDIIVLGGGHTDDLNLSSNNQLSLTALGRLVEGIRIHRMLPGSRLILSGSSGRSELAQALILYRTALILGIDSSSMAMQTKPSNTLQESEEYVRNFGTDKTLIIVTCATHMPRAVYNFRKAGISPIAAPTGFILKYGSKKESWDWLPDVRNIEKMETVLHEYVGILWARIGGR
jgi:uncharacterized SAM-binding protein YcdF (DUF218 family)